MDGKPERNQPPQAPEEPASSEVHFAPVNNGQSPMASKEHDRPKRTKESQPPEKDLGNPDQGSVSP